MLRVWATFTLGILLRMSAEYVEETLWATPVVLAATPIGNLADTTERLKQLIRSAEVIACEDTRRTRHLIQILGLSTPAKLLSLHEHNEASRSAELVEAAGGGSRILVVSDAGMPAVSDPGFRLVAALAAAAVPVTAAPGASAVTTALVLSGLPTEQFTFAGFMPRKQSLRQQLLRRLAAEEWTTVIFESPHRVAATLGELAGVLGEHRQAAVARELTKKYEEVLRGPLAELAEELATRAAQDQVKGEFVIVLGGAQVGDDGSTAPSLDQLAEEVLELAAGGQRLKTAAQQVAAAHGLKTNQLYNAAVARRGTG